MRIFYAVSIDENTKREIKKKTSEIGTFITAGRSIDPYNYHVTLEYVGEIDKRDIDHYCGILNEAADNASGSDIKFNVISSFRRNKAHLIYLKGEHQKELEDIRNKIISKLPGNKKPFLPHITLYRDTLLEAGINMENIPDLISYSPITVRAENISLMESSLINGKLVYITLFDVRL